VGRTLGFIRWGVMLAHQSFAKRRQGMIKKWLVLSSEPFECDDVDIVLEMYGKGVKIYKEVEFKTFEELREAG
jgi:hypothetical protein